MRAEDLILVSVDDHLVEPPGMFDGRLPAHLQDRAPKVVETEEGHVDAGEVVVALGPWSPDVLVPLGIRLPVYPLKGYSLTVPITDAAMAPMSTVLGTWSMP